MYEIQSLSRTPTPQWHHKFCLLQHISSLEVGKVKLKFDRIALSDRKWISIGAMYRRTVMIAIY